MQARGKGYYHDRVDAEMAALATPDWSVPQKLALACRMLAAEGHWRGLAGPDHGARRSAGAFPDLGFGVGYDEATASGLVEVDDDLRRFRPA